jgi:cyclic pyranopterin phosphate synthase
LRAIDTALDLGFDPVKVNVVVMKGTNESEIPSFVDMTKDKNINVCRAQLQNRSDAVNLVDL